MGCGSSIEKGQETVGEQSATAATTSGQNTGSKEYIYAEVNKHNTLEDLWVVIHGMVYDVTEYKSQHPGGVAELLFAAGQDGSVRFDEACHGFQARSIMSRFELGPCPDAPGHVQTPVAETIGLDTQLGIRIDMMKNEQKVKDLPPNDDQINKYQLIDKQTRSRDTALYSFASDDKNVPLPVFPAGYHIVLTGQKGVLRRKYSPIYSDENRFDLLIKSYPRGGVSEHIASLSINDVITGSVPLPSATLYTDKLLHRQLLFFFVMGTGIAPMYRLVMEKISMYRANPSLITQDKHKMYMLIAYRTEDDMLMEAELKAAPEEFPEGLSIIRVISKGDCTKSNSISGRIGAEITRKHMPEFEAAIAQDNYQVFICGSLEFESVLSYMCQEKFHASSKNILTLV